MTGVSTYVGSPFCGTHLGSCPSYWYLLPLRLVGGIVGEIPSQTKVRNLIGNKVMCTDLHAHIYVCTHNMHH